MNQIRFCLEVFVENRTSTVRSGYITLERVMTGLSFLPPKGTKVMALKGLEDAQLNLETSGEIRLFSEDEGYEWYVTIIDQRRIQNEVPTLTAEEVENALNAGWELN